MASAAEGDITPQTIKEKWSREQIALEKRIVVEDDLSFDPITFEGLKYIGGADISFVRDDSVNACAALVILSYPDLELVHCSCSMIKLTLPYIPGYLAFREGPFIRNKIDLLRKEKPDLMPQMLFLDGNGLLHSRGAGLACHVGVENDVPCIGVAKKLFCTKGIEKNEDHRRRIESLEGEGDSFPLVGTTGTVLGKAVLTGKESTNPVYVSVGHRVSLDTAVSLALKCSRYRVPEPIRWADIKSREYIRENLELSS